MAICLSTTSLTALRRLAACASSSMGNPCSLAVTMPSRSAGRGRLPTWVVRIRALLRIIQESQMGNRNQKPSGDSLRLLITELPVPCSTTAFRFGEKLAQIIEEVGRRAGDLIDRAEHAIAADRTNVN